MATPHVPKKKGYTQETLEHAIDLVKTNAMSLHAASKAYSIPYATLLDKLRCRRPVQSQKKRLEQAKQKKRLQELKKKERELKKDTEGKNEKGEKA